MPKMKRKNLPEIVKNNCQHLNPEERTKLLEVLMELKDLFGGSLGDWDTKKKGVNNTIAELFQFIKSKKETIIK